MISSKQYNAFLLAVLDGIEGDWVLVGGALMAILMPGARVTADIDLCPLGELTNERRINLMKIAESSGLSLDAINPAADFFLRQIPNWRSAVVLHLKGKRGSLYRPSLYLYLRLKTERLTESDVTDCLAFLNWHRREKIDFNSDEIKDFLVSKIQREAQPKRRLLLEKIFNEFGF